ncbi:YWFCY domain-containing protein [Nubsella zeaxanthinifaciens]|uniref:YWFCY domain-containing protein n=1 Tax=Nubsella zeaxanthinifaciens TaxID=392412 RepID=UPI000DE2B312|nr:YWFCY domain-containing protein [Nubsella zeaxanthinifaciens]
MNTGEDIQALRKIADFTRLISVFILAIHFYLCCYLAFKQWGWTAEITDRIMANIAKTGLFNSILKPKLASLLCLAISLVAISGRKDEKIQLRPIIAYLLSGLILYFISVLCFYLNGSPSIIAISYITLTATGYMLILTGGGLLSRLIKEKLKKDIFNTDNETFPQEERLLENEYSVNLPTKYRLKDEQRDSWINVINPFRGMLVAGTPGAGKSYFVIRHIIDQHIRKGFSMFLYDFKYDDLSRIAYNKLLKYKDNYEIKPSFYIINFVQNLCYEIPNLHLQRKAEARYQWCVYHPLQRQRWKTTLLSISQHWFQTPKTGTWWIRGQHSKDCHQNRW